MISPETPPPSGAPRDAHAQSSGKRIMLVITTLLLAAGFVFSSASTAVAAPTFTNGHIAAAPCRGDKPGFCPDPSGAQPGEQGATHELDNQSTTRQTNE